MHIEEIVGWSSTSRPAQGGADLPEPLARQLNEESASASTSTVFALGGSLIDGSDVGDWGALGLHAPRAASSPRAQRSSSFASAASQSADSASVRFPQSRGGLPDLTLTPEPRSPVVPFVGKFFLLFIWAGLACILSIV